jgi:hypothetical protein
MAESKSKNPKEKRDYKKEYARDQKKRIKYRTELGRKQRELEKSGKASKGDGKDNAHVKDVRKGGDAAGKTVATKAATNRAWRKGKKGYDRG